MSSVAIQKSFILLHCVKQGVDFKQLNKPRKLQGLNNQSV